jgi:hypothetical protein
LKFFPEFLVLLPSRSQYMREMVIHKLPPKPEENQSARFIEAAKKAEADLSGKEFEKAFKKIVKAEKPGKKPAA